MGIGIDAIIMGILVSIGSAFSLVFAILASVALMKYQPRELEWRIMKVEGALAAGLGLTFVACMIVVFGPGIRFENLIAWPFILAYVVGSVSGGLRLYIELVSGDYEPSQDTEQMHANNGRVSQAEEIPIRKE